MILTDFIVALLLGGMIFFPIVVAPVVFKALADAQASRFLRLLFPRYYLYVILLSGAGLGVALIADKWVRSAVFGAIALSTLWVLVWLVPQINAARDRELEGDQEAATDFKNRHRLSVMINLAQMVALFVLFLLPATPS